MDFDVGVNAVFWGFFFKILISLMIELNNSYLEIFIEFCRIEGFGWVDNYGRFGRYWRRFVWGC